MPNKDDDDVITAVVSAVAREDVEPHLVSFVATAVEPILRGGATQVWWGKLLRLLWLLTRTPLAPSPYVATTIGRQPSVVDVVVVTTSKGRVRQHNG